MDYPGRPEIGGPWSLVAFATTALILSAFGREASARCHAPERPALSRAFSLNLASNVASVTFVEIDVSPVPMGFRSVPCDDESASRPDLKASQYSAERAAATMFDSPHVTTALITGSTALQRHMNSPIDRPPRAA